MKAIRKWGTVFIMAMSFLAVCICVQIPIYGAVDTELPLEIKRRLAWASGYEHTTPILTIAEPQEVSIGRATVLPGGVTLGFEAGQVMMYWSPTPEQIGLQELKIQVHNMMPPPFDNWSGPLMVTSETVVVQVWVYSEGDHPFLTGGPDILVSPTQ